jgi:hypothetical protein
MELTTQVMHVICLGGLGALTKGARLGVECDTSLDSSSRSLSESVKNALSLPAAPVTATLFAQY